MKKILLDLLYSLKNTVIIAIIMMLKIIIYFTLFNRILLYIYKKVICENNVQIINSHTNM